MFFTCHDPTAQAYSMPVPQTIPAVKSYRRPTCAASEKHFFYINSYNKTA